MGVSTMLAGLLPPCFRRTVQNLLALLVVAGRPRGLNDARASMRPIPVHRSTWKASAARFAYTEF